MSTITETAVHSHKHTQNRFAVIPTHDRLCASADYAGRGITIALLDSGFYPHPDLTEPVNRIAAFKDISEEAAALASDQPSQSWQWHGTQTSVVAAGNGRLSDGIYRGLAHEAQLVLVKVSHEGRITEEAIARGIEWVIKNRDLYNIRVLSISLGGDEDIPCSQSIIDRAAEEAIRQGIVVVAAAGNSGLAERHTSVPPANSPSVITVGGYDDRNQIEDRNYQLYHSNYGATADGIVKPEIIAPAMWVAAPILPGTPLYRTAECLSQIVEAPDYDLRRVVRSLWREAGLPEALQFAETDRIRAAAEELLRENKIVATHYQHVDGTSFAAPIVAAVVAQMLEANPRLTPASIKHILISTADRITGAAAIRQGYGVLNALRAVELAVSDHHVLTAALLSPPRVEGGKLVFLYHNDVARKVALVGEFNNWQKDSALFSRVAGGFWRAEIDAPPAGTYQYKFIVDGERWVDDPNNGFKAPDNYGGLNSVLYIKGDAPLI